MIFSPGRDAGAIDKTVQMAEAFERLPYCGFAVRFGGHVGLDCSCPVAERRRIGFRRRAVDIRKDDARASLNEAPRDGCAEARASPGDNEDLVA